MSDLREALERRRDELLAAEKRDASLKDWNMADRWRYMASGVEEALKLLALAQTPAADAGLAELRRQVERRPRFGVVDGAITPHPRGTMVELDAVLALMWTASLQRKPPRLGTQRWPTRTTPRQPSGEATHPRAGQESFTDSRFGGG